LSDFASLWFRAGQDGTSLNVERELLKLREA